ncbi:late histone H2A.1-like [Panulirus ornatus]|uniref:late histone H2A.1-like n=1 Tax=Panulirus ornatus TaxID=150431 RepID=UPI003A84CB69
MTTRSAVPQKKTLAYRASLQFPVSRIHRYLKAGNYASRISLIGSVFCAAVLEYLTAEILELSGNIAHRSKKKRIIPRHILLAVRHDEELNKMLEGVTIPEGGVVPNIYTALLPK